MLTTTASFESIITFLLHYHIMSTTRPFLTLVCARQSLLSSRILLPRSYTNAIATAAFSTSSARHATPAGPPPKGFRLPPPERWDERKESTMDQAGRYFLMTEMLRGMYVVLEQFFRPP